MTAFFRRHGEWTRFFLLVGLVIATNFLDVRYVPKGEYAADRREVAAAIGNMTTAIALLQKTEAALSDHESRIRTLEQLRRSSQSKVNYEVPVFGPGPDVFYAAVGRGE